MSEPKVFVTRAAEIEFERPARLGEAITFTASIARIGLTSVCVEVHGAARGEQVCAARMTFVNVGPDGKKSPVNG